MASPSNNGTQDHGKIELESTYVSRIAQRKALYVEQGPRVLGALPGTETLDACVELVEMVVQFLCIRYPNQFTFNARTRVFENKILEVTTVLKPKTSRAALEFLLDHVPEEFALVLEDEKTGLCLCRAGVMCSAVGWSLNEKMGKALYEIHGTVPDYKDKLQFSMDRYFLKMPCDKPMQRASWGLEIGQPLFLPRFYPDFADRESQDPKLTIDDINLRVDWQTLRRIPRSQAIVFNFKALFTPLPELRYEAYIPKLLLKVTREMKEGLEAYKGTWHVQHVVLPKLEEWAWAKEQEMNGLVKEGWEERTLDEDPFYPGWDESQ